MGYAVAHVHGHVPNGCRDRPRVGYVVSKSKETCAVSKAVVVLRAINERLAWCRCRGAQPQMVWPWVPGVCTGRSVAQLRPSHERPLRIVTTQLRPNHELRIWEVQIQNLHIQNLRILSSGQTTSGSQRLHRTAMPLEPTLEPLRELPQELPQELPGLPPRGLQTRLFGR